jgi:hypothetical protein
MERLNRPVMVDAKKVDKYKPNNFALQGVYKGVGVQYEYKIDNQWSSERPTQKPEGRRVVFEGIDQFRAAKDTYFAWQDISALQNPLLKPERPEEVLKRLLKARMGDSVTLFVPWGVRISGEFGPSEEFVLDRMAGLQNSLLQRKISSQIFLMPADLYATEVNNQVRPDDAQNYFRVVKKEAEDRNMQVKSWSEIRSENWETYLRRSNELSEEEIIKLLSPAKVREAVGAASRRSGYSSQEAIAKAAFAYLRERICEAEIVEDRYQPIKVSAVAKNKDNGVDRELPRIYIVPDLFQFPWLK